MGDALGAIGQVAGAFIQSSAQKKIASNQLAAIKKQQEFLFSNLDPNVINAQSTKADILRAYSQLQLQGSIDPDLLKARYGSEAGLLKALDEINDPESAGAMIAELATKEAAAETSVAGQTKQQLIDRALEDLRLGAKLPPDVQAELVQAGLEKSGMVTGRASGQGQGGTMLRTILGEAGLRLKAQRTAEAAQLTQTAQNLESSRSQILQSLFPNLQQRQLATMGANAAAFGTAQGAVPQAGLSGTDVANIWMARVGATNQLTQNAADVAARQSAALGSIYSNLAGGLSRSVGPAAQQVSGWFSPGTPTTQFDQVGSDISGGAF